MISDIYKVFIDFGDGLTLWDAQYKNFEKTEVMHKKLKGADNYCTFILTPSITLANKLRGIGRPGALVSITKNEAPWFYGYIRKTFSLKKVSRLEPVKIEAVSPSFRLKRKIREAVYFQEFTVSNPASPATSIIHTLFTRAGVPLERIDMPTINYSVPVYYIEENTATWYALIEEILYQYEYIIDFDVYGRAIARKIAVDSLSVPSAVFVSGKSGNINGSIEAIVREEERDIVEVEWAELEVLENITVFSDTTGAAPTKKASIILDPSARYGNDDGSGMYAELSVEGKELIYATGITLDCEKNEDIAVDIFEAFPKRVRISLHNRNAVFPREITKLDIKASWATVKKAVNKSKVVNADTEYSETEKISANRIHSKEAAGALCSALAWYYKYSDHTYKFSSSLDVVIGSIVSVTDSEIGTVDARVIQKKEDATSSLFSYELEAIADYVPSFSTHEYFAEERETLPRKDYDEAIQAIADELLELAQGDIDFRLDLEKVRNGDIINGAIMRAALESGIQEELEALSGDLFPDGLGNASRIDMIEPRSALTNDMIETILSLVSESEEQIIMRGSEITLVSSKVDEDRTRMASIELKANSIEQIVAELIPMADGQIANLSKIEQTAEALEMLVTTGKYNSDTGETDTFTLAQTKLLKDRFEVFVSGDGSDFAAASWVVSQDEIAGVVQGIVENDEGISATIAEMVQANDRINLLVGEVRTDTIERLDDAVMSLQAGIMITSQEVRLGVQNLEAETQALLSVQSDRINAVVSDTAKMASAILSMKSEQIEAMVKGGGTQAYMSMSVTVPATIDALTRNRMIAAVGVEKVNAVYELTAGGFWYVRPSASSLAIKALKDSLRTAGLLGSQITLDADEILMGGKVRAANIYTDEITIGTSQVSGLTEIGSGKIKTNLINADELVVKKLAIDSNPNTSTDFEVNIDEINGIIIRKNGIVLFSVLPNGDAILRNAVIDNVSMQNTEMVDVSIYGRSLFMGDIDSGPLLLSSSQAAGNYHSYAATTTIYDLWISLCALYPENYTEEPSSQTSTGFYGIRKMAVIGTFGGRNDVRYIQVGKGIIRDSASYSIIVYFSDGTHYYDLTGYLSTSKQIGSNLYFAKGAFGKTLKLRDLPVAPGIKDVVYVDANGFIKISR